MKIYGSFTEQQNELLSNKIYTSDAKFISMSLRTSKKLKKRE